VDDDEEARIGFRAMIGLLQARDDDYGDHDEDDEEEGSAEKKEKTTQTMKTSRYRGVSRTSKDSQKSAMACSSSGWQWQVQAHWVFSSEKLAALAYDHFLRKNGIKDRPFNFAPRGGYSGGDDEEVVEEDDDDDNDDDGDEEEGVSGSKFTLRKKSLRLINLTQRRPAFNYYSSFILSPHTLSFTVRTGGGRRGGGRRRCQDKDQQREMWSW